MDLLVALVHEINARAERRVEKQLFSQMREVRGREAIVFRFGGGGRGQPRRSRGQVLFPVVGKETRRDLAAEYRARGRMFREKV